MAELRLGLVGCGRLAERGYVPAVRLAQGVRLSAVADPVSARCAHAAPGVPSYPSAAELIDARAADLLVLATPAHAHLPDARLAAEAGIPTLVEKPPAPTAREAAELTELVPPPWIGFNRRFEPALRALRQTAHDLARMDLSFVLRRRKHSWRSHEVDDDVVLSLGPHLVDLAFWIFQCDPQRVAARVQGQRAVFEIGFGVRGEARIECVGNRPYLERVDLRGEDGRVARYERGGVRQAVLGILRRSESPLVPSLARQLESLARAVRGSPEPDLATASDGLRVMRTLAVANDGGDRSPLQ
jgi:predicted dehydrogenase